MSDSSNNDIALPFSLAPTADEAPSTYPRASTSSQVSSSAPNSVAPGSDGVQEPVASEASEPPTAIPAKASVIAADDDAVAADDTSASQGDDGATKDVKMPVQPAGTDTPAKGPSPTAVTEAASVPPSSSDSLFASASPPPQGDQEATPGTSARQPDGAASQSTATTTIVPTVSPDVVKDPLPADAEPPGSPQPDHADLVGQTQNSGDDNALPATSRQHDSSSSATALQLNTQPATATDAHPSREEEGSVARPPPSQLVEALHDDASSADTVLASSNSDDTVISAATPAVASVSAPVLSEPLGSTEGMVTTISGTSASDAPASSLPSGPVAASTPRLHSEAASQPLPQSGETATLGAQSDDVKTLSLNSLASLDASTDSANPRDSKGLHDSRSLTQDLATRNHNVSADAMPPSTSATPTNAEQTEQVSQSTKSPSAANGNARESTPSLPPAKAEPLLSESEQGHIDANLPSATASQPLSTTADTAAASTSADPSPRTSQAEASQASQSEEPKHVIERAGADGAASAAATSAEAAQSHPRTQDDGPEGSRVDVSPTQPSEHGTTAGDSAETVQAAGNDDPSQGQKGALRPINAAEPTQVPATRHDPPSMESKAEPSNATSARDNGNATANASIAEKQPEPSIVSKALDGQQPVAQDEHRIALVLSANQELIRLCVELQGNNAATSSLFRDMSHRLQTNLAFLAGIADSAQRGPSANGPSPPTTTPRVDIFPHPSLSAELAALSKDTTLPQLYAGLAKAFEGAPRSTGGGPLAHAAAAAPPVNGTSAPSPRERKHSRESSSADEPNKRRQGLPNGSSATSARTSSSPAPSNTSFVHPFGGTNANSARPKSGGLGRSASPAGSATSQGVANEAGNAQGNQPQQLPGVTPQQSQQLVQMYGPNAVLTWRLLQNFLRTPQCTPQFAAMPLPNQMQQIAAMQQHRQRLMAQQQQQQQQQGQGVRPGTPNAAASPGGTGSMGPPAPISVGSPFTPGLDPFGSGGSRSGSVDINGAPNAGSPGSLARRSVSGDGQQMARNTPPNVPMQVMNPFAATGLGSGSTSSAASTPGANGGVNGSAAHFASVGSDLGMANAVGLQQQQQYAMYPGQQLPQGQNGQGMMPAQQQGQQSMGIPPSGGNLQQQLQQLQAMHALRQQQQQQQQQQPHMLPQQFFPGGGGGGGQVNGIQQQQQQQQQQPLADPNQLPPHLQQLFAHQQMQATSGVNPGMAGGGAVPGSLGGWPGQGLNGQSGVPGQGQANHNQGFATGGGINPAALFGGPQQPQQPPQQAHQVPFGGWAGSS